MLYLPVKQKRDVAQFGRASALGAESRRFKSCHPDRKPTDNIPHET